MTKSLVLLNYIVLLVLAVGCDDPLAGEENIIDYGTKVEIIQLDVSGSCADSCGNLSPQGCWCDEICEFYEDCCRDKPKICASSPKKPPRKKTMISDLKSCSGYCDEKAPSGCWCDTLCERIGDCCPDVKGQCNP